MPSTSNSLCFGEKVADRPGDHGEKNVVDRYPQGPADLLDVLETALGPVDPAVGAEVGVERSPGRGREPSRAQRVHGRERPASDVHRQFPAAAAEAFAGCVIESTVRRVARAASATTS